MVVVLHNIRSMHNVGSIFRTANAAGVEKIYLCGFTSAPVNEFNEYRIQISKVALGAEKLIKWEKRPKTHIVLDNLKKEGYKIYAIEQSENSTPYFKEKIKKSDKIALVLGHEIEGLPETILKRADKILEIPMQGKILKDADHPHKLSRSKGKGSLNVSVAFGVVIFSLINR